MNGEVDIAAIFANVERLVRAALADGYAGLFASGDMHWEFGSGRNLEKLLDYETRLEQLFSTVPAFYAICQYHRDILPATALQAAFYTHQTIYVNSTLALLNAHHGKSSTLREMPPEN